MECAVLVGHSLGGLTALLVALAAPERVTALGLVGRGGLGREVSPALAAISEPVLGELGVVWSRTPVGAVQRAGVKALLLFGRPWLVPPRWLAEQYRLARRPGFLDTALAALRDQATAGDSAGCCSGSSMASGCRRCWSGRPGPSRPAGPRPPSRGSAC